MHPNYKRANEWSSHLLAAAIEVHKCLGPGLLESIYEKCLIRELELRNIRATTQAPVQVKYKGIQFEESLRLDLLVEDCLVVELKAVELVLPIHKAQLLSYMRLINAPLGLLINFHETKLVQGVHRLILRGADSENATQLSQ